MPPPSHQISAPTRLSPTNQTKFIPNKKINGTLYTQAETKLHDVHMIRKEMAHNTCKNKTKIKQAHKNRPRTWKLNLVKPKARMTYKPEDIGRKLPFKIIKNIRGSFVTRSSVKSIKKFKQTFQTSIRTRKSTAWSPRAVSASSHISNSNWARISRRSSSAATAEVPKWIQQHAAQVEHCRQMVNEEDILKQQLLESLDENTSRVRSNNISTTTNSHWQVSYINCRMIMVKSHP